jgi:hypothetical protein
MNKIIMWLGAAAAVLFLMAFAWKTGMAPEVIWMGALIACLALPAWAMVALDDDNAES